MTARQWLKPAECARLIGHRDAGCILAAIKSGELPARVRNVNAKVARYIVRVDDFERWFEDTWKPTTRKAS
jgi:hypothetical protein